MSNVARIRELTDDIAANRVPGGSAFARAAAELIALRVETLHPSATADDVRVMVTEAAEWAARTKPSMAVVRNVSELAVSVLSDTETEASVLRGTVVEVMHDFMKRSTEAISVIGGFANELFSEGSTVLIHSYSASLEALLRTAVADGRHFQLLVTESRPYRESRRLIEAVADSRIDIVVSDAAIAVAAASADLALVGADSVYTDGSFANKTGSYPLALACRESGAPLYVATELAKVYFGDADDVEMELRPATELSEGWPLIESGRVRVWNQFFERVDASFVHRYVTEVGLLESHAIRAAASASWPSPPVNRSAARELHRNGLSMPFDVALVVVRKPSPFLPNNVLEQRTAICAEHARVIATHTEIISRVGVSQPIEQIDSRITQPASTALIAWSAHGLITTPAEAGALTRILDTGAALFTASSGRLVPLTADQMKAALPARPTSAAAELRQHAASTRDGRLAVAREGRWLGGRSPIGWIVDDTGDATLDISAASFIRTGTRMVASGTKLGSVVAQWNAAGFTTVTGRKWTFGSARRVLQRARNAGLVQHRGEIVGRSAWPAIVTVSEWNQARRQLTPRRSQQIA